MMSACKLLCAFWRANALKPALCVLCGALALFTSPIFAEDASSIPVLIPQPLRIERNAGSALVSDGTPIVYAAGDEAAKFDAENLSQLMARSRGLRLHPVASPLAKDGFRIELERTQQDDVREAYTLNVAPEHIIIRASSDAGLYYGTVTLWQLLTADVKMSGPARLDAMTIHDKPQLRWRGIMVDSARHMQSIEFLHQLVDWMSLEKLNTLHWHLTDDQAWRLEIRRYPRLTAVGAWRALPDQQGKRDPTTGKVWPLYGGFYSQQQVRELVAYAARRNVMIVPEIEMPGHATAAIAAYPELGSSSVSPKVPANYYGIFTNLYSPTPKTFTFLENVLTEVMELFPGPYIHVGGDEALKDEWRASPAIQAQMKAEGIATEDQLQSHFIRKINTFLAAHGRRMIGWDEILEGGLAPNAAVMSWHGIRGGLDAARQGHDAVLTPVRPLYFDFRQTDAIAEISGRYGNNTLADVYRFDPLPSTLTSAERAHIMGVQANVWSEYLITEDRIAWMIFPRAAALAEIGWSTPENRSWTGFLARMPAELSRYKALGIPYDPNAYRVQSRETLLATAPQSVKVSLANQVSFGDLRYTTDGAPVTTTSALYTGPLLLTMPAHLRAAAFAGGTMIAGSEMEQLLDQDSVRRTFSGKLRPCLSDPVIAMEHDPPQRTRPVMVANYRNPCWIEKAAPMDGVKAITLQMQPLPWVFEDGPHKEPVLLPTKSPNGEVDVHLDSCSGIVLSSLPLPWTTGTAEPVTLRSNLPPISGVHDLCVVVLRPALDPLWTLNWSQLQAGKDR